MPLKIFITGISGYIAGDAAFALLEAHSEYEYAALVRSESKAAAVKKAFPSVRTVLGSLEDADVLKKESAWADVVLHAADSSDHEGAAKAIVAGLLEGHDKERPGYWLHTGGTGILTYTDAAKSQIGEWSTHEYNDWDGVDQLISLPDHAFHRNVDKLVLEAAEQHGDVIKTALICPPTIYGKGRGPVSGRGRQAYEMAKLILSEKYVPIVGQGKARWNNIHVADLSQLYLLLVEAAAAQKSDAELWGPRAYYLTENGEHLWSELAELMGTSAAKLGYVDAPLEKRDLSRDEALKAAGFEAESWGLNSRGKSERARKVLNWKPTHKTLEEEVDEILKSEHVALKQGL